MRLFCGMLGRDGTRRESRADIASIAKRLDLPAETPVDEAYLDALIEASGECPACEFAHAFISGPKCDDDAAISFIVIELTTNEDSFVFPKDGPTRLARTIRRVEWIAPGAYLCMRVSEKEAFDELGSEGVNQA